MVCAGRPPRRALQPPILRLALGRTPPAGRCSAIACLGCPLRTDRRYAAGAPTRPCRKLGRSRRCSPTRRSCSSSGRSAPFALRRFCGAVWRIRHPVRRRGRLARLWRPPPPRSQRMHRGDPPGARRISRGLPPLFRRRLYAKATSPDPPTPEQLSVARLRPGLSGSRWRPLIAVCLLEHYSSPSCRQKDPRVDLIARTNAEFHACLAPRG